MKEILYDWGGWNLWLFHAINNIRGPAIDVAMRAGTVLGNHSLFSVYAAVAAFWGSVSATRAGDREAVARTWLSAIAVFGLAYVSDQFLVGWLKTWFDFPRPPAVLPPDSLHVIGEPEYYYSLPSGHAVFAVTVALSLWAAAGWLSRLILIVFVLWVGVSRVSLGVHFPADVVAGYLVGAVVVIMWRVIVVAMVRLAERD